MIGALTLLLGCQLVGEALARALALPIPGPVIGFALLAAGLLVDARRRNAPPEEVERTALGQLATALLANLGLLFVPAGVGVIDQLPLLGDHGLAIGIALIASTVLALLVTVAIFRCAARIVS